MRVQVGGLGPTTAKVVLVGEYPITDDVQAGAPFSGQVGETLQSLLSSAGIPFFSCYRTSVIKERPIKNRLAEFITFHKKRGITHTEKYLTHVIYLRKELAGLENPHILVAFGETALYTLTGKTKIDKWQGSCIPCTLEGLEHLKVVPCLHPSTCLRQYKNHYIIRACLAQVAQQMTTKEIQRTERTLHLAPTFEEACTYLRTAIETKKPIAFDIEVTKLEVSCLAFCNTLHEGLCIPFRCHTGDYFSIPEEVEIWNLIAQLLQDPEIEKITQNGVFDSGFLLRTNSIYTRNIQDSMVAHAILYPDLPKNLDFLCATRTDHPFYSDHIKGEDGLNFGANCFSEEADRAFWEYNALDAILTYEVFYKLLPVLEQTGNTATYHRQRAIIEPLIYAGELGLRVDLDLLAELKKETKKKMDSLAEEFQALYGEEPLPDKFLNSPKQLCTYFYSTLKYPTYKDRKTHKPTVNDIALTRLARKGCKQASVLAAYRKEKKLYSTYLEAKLDPDNRIRSSFNAVGTNTGRVSSSKTIFKTGLNFQNMPPVYRKVIGADPGYLIVEADLSGADNRVVAPFDAAMQAGFERGLDMHAYTYSLLFEVPYEEVSRVKGSVPFGNGKYSQRDIGKAGNHSLNYGMAYSAFGLKYELLDKDSKLIIERYHALYPGVRGNFHKMIERSLEESRSVTNPYGRRRLFTERAKNRGRWIPSYLQAAYAFFPQSTVADKINQDGLAFVYEHPELDRVQIINQVHDSCVFQFPLDLELRDCKGVEAIALALSLLKDSLETPIPWKQGIKAPCDFEAGLIWGEKTSIDMSQSLSGVAEQLEKIGELK